MFQRNGVGFDWSTLFNLTKEEKEEFEKDLAFTRQNELLRQKQQEQNKERTQEQIDKGMERGE